MIRVAKEKDLSKIMEIIQATIEIMGSENNPQWDALYPQRKDFHQDILDKSLFVFEEAGQVKGMLCINTVEPIEYGPVTWSSREKALVLHRMAIDPAARKQGIGLKFMKFAEQVARESAIGYLKTDTFSENVKMNGLFQKCGYQKVGDIHFRGLERLFYCYDKVLNN